MYHQSVLVLFLSCLPVLQRYIYILIILGIALKGYYIGDEEKEDYGYP
jgi:hypothetical protein